MPFGHFFFGWDDSPTKIDRKKVGTCWYPYSNLSTGGPRLPGPSTCWCEIGRECGNEPRPWSTERKPPVGWFIRVIVQGKSGTITLVGNPNQFEGQLEGPGIAFCKIRYAPAGIWFVLVFHAVSPCPDGLRSK